MNQSDIKEEISAKMKLIRIENNYTQEQMATVLGISKKSLVQIEKRRINANWTITIATCALFRNSEIIRHALGGDALKTLESAVHHT
ncbi:helix-turn-helix transcriptional regulator [Lentibacillus halodurans]|nr:helix-turn-helix domain-containing protein [Lentibacillus halodurans]